MKQLLCLTIAALTIVVLCGLCWVDNKREEKPRFKGVELYSWKDRTGEWKFALLDGSNRLKTEDEVKAPKHQIKGVGDLKKRFAHLAVGEKVFWTHLILGFEFPPKATRKEIEKAAKDTKIDLRILGKE
jgi:hypothetical protein